MDESHPILGWFHVPNREFTVRSASTNAGVLVRINSHGLREHEYPLEAPAGTFRILILGDGYTSSYEFALDQVWHELLEEALRQQRFPGLPNRRIEIIAAGVPGWSTDQHLLYYKHEGYKYRPSLVIVQFVLDDLYANDPGLFEPALKVRKPYFVLTPNGIELRNFPFANPAPSRLRAGIAGFWGFVKQITLPDPFRSLLRLTPLARRRGCYSPLDVDLTTRVYATSQPLLYEESWRLTQLLFQQLNAEVTQRQQRLAVIYLPEKRQLFQDVWEQSLACLRTQESVSWDLDRPNRMLGAILQQEGIPYLDLTPSFRSYTRASARDVYLSRGHLNLDGHRETARSVREWLGRVFLLAAE